MSIKHRPALRLAALTLPALLISVSTFAAERSHDINRDEDRTVGFGTHFEEPVVPLAPVGHRQPRAADVPKLGNATEEDEWLNRLNRDTDSKLQICRGC